MKTWILAVAVLLVVAGSAGVLATRDFSIVGYDPNDLDSDDKVWQMYESWLIKYRKADNSLDEKRKRFIVFKDNLHYIDAQNRRNLSYWLGLNEFADLTHQEFKAKFLGNIFDVTKKRKSPSPRYQYNVGDTLPDSVDWRKKRGRGESEESSRLRKLLGILGSCSCGRYKPNCDESFDYSV